MTMALITGGTGFTGAHLARALLQRGDRVRVLARRPDRAVALAAAGAEVIGGDLLDPASVQRAMAGCTHVYHVAALYRSARYADSVYYDVNVNGTRAVLQAARREGVQRVVHCSTVGVHGEITEIPADEDTRFAPDDVYQKSKLEAELLARDAFDDGLPGTIVRPVGIYGPGDVRFLKLFRAVQRGRFRMIGSGNVLYHLTYIDDLVRGMVLCGEHPAAIGNTFILCGPRYTTLNELVATLCEVLQQRVVTGWVPVWPVRWAALACETICRPLGVEPPLHRRRLDFFVKNRAFVSDRARHMLGYRPSVDLACGLARTAQWYIQQGWLRPLPNAPTAQACISTPLNELSRV